MEWIMLIVSGTYWAILFIRERLNDIWWDGWTWGVAWIVPAFLAGVWWGRRKQTRKR